MVSWGPSLPPRRFPSIVWLGTIRGQLGLLPHCLSHSRLHFHHTWQSAALLSSPTSLQQKIKILNTAIQLGIKYAFYATPFSILDIHIRDTLLIKLTKSVCNLTICTRHIFIQLPKDIVDIETTSLLPKYTTTLGECLTQTLNNPCPLGQIYQGLIKFIITK